MDGSVSFVKRPARFSKGRLIFTVPKDLVRLLDPESVYEVTVRAIGSLQPKGAS